MPGDPLNYHGPAGPSGEPQGDAFWGAVAMLLFAGALVLAVTGMLFGNVQSKLLVAQVGTGFVGVLIATMGTDFDRKKALATLALVLNALAMGCGCCVGAVRLFGRA